MIYLRRQNKLFQTEGYDLEEAAPLLILFSALPSHNDGIICLVPRCKQVDVLSWYNDTSLRYRIVHAGIVDKGLIRRISENNIGVDFSFYTYARVY